MLLAKEKGVWKETGDVRVKENMDPNREIRTVFPVLFSKSEYWYLNICTIYVNILVLRTQARMCNLYITMCLWPHCNNSYTSKHTHDYFSVVMP